MKYVEKFILVIFSIAMLGLAVVCILTSLGYIDLVNIVSLKINYIKDYTLLTVILSSIVVILSLIGIFSSDENKEDKKTGIATNHESGTVFMTKETFESIVYNITRSYDSLKNVKVGIVISEEGLYVNVYTYITPDTIVPDITLKLQKDIKDIILKQTTVEVKEANIKIKGVVSIVKKEGV